MHRVLASCDFLFSVLRWRSLCLAMGLLRWLFITLCLRRTFRRFGSDAAWCKSMKGQHKEKEETYWKLELPLCIKTTLIKLIKKLIKKNQFLQSKFPTKRSKQVTRKVPTYLRQFWYLFMKNASGIRACTYQPNKWLFPLHIICISCTSTGNTVVWCVYTALSSETAVKKFKC